MISLAHAQQAAGTAPDYSGILMMVVMFVVLWFMMVRPQMKKAKEHKALLEGLAKGDEVITQGGMAGRVTKLGDLYIHVDIADGKDGGVEIIVQKSAVALVLPKGTIKGL